MTNDTNNSGLNSRLSEIIIRLGIGKKELADKCGLSANQIHNYLNGSQEPGTKFYRNLKINFPNINLNWLITGEGQLFIDDLKTESETSTPQTSNIVELNHMNLIRDFIDKNRALNINTDLIDIEKLDPETYIRVESYVRGTADNVRDKAERSPYGRDKRAGAGRGMETPDPTVKG